ncbi:MAG: LamG domain-containing protein [Verrucomicrobia bacterium]|nr:LamG domain-containing protein [Verrucomicrobiota bacterium]
MNPRILALLTVLLASLASLHAAEPRLVAHWNFDEGSGDIAKDVTGHGHDATLKNVEWVPSPRGHALRFDSKADLARYGGVDSMNLTGDVTLAVWVKSDSAAAPNTHRLIFGDDGPGIARNLHLSLDSYNRLSFEWADGRSNDSLLAPASLLNGLWKHVAVVADSRAMQVAMYVDGVVVARKPMSLPISKAPVKERLTGWFYNGFFQGELDDIQLYNRALAAKEIQRLFVAQADVQAGAATVLFDASRSEPRGIVSTTFRNWSKQPRRLEVGGPAVAKRELTLKPGAAVEVTLGEVALQPVWRNRNDLFICEQKTGGAASVAVRRGDAVERMSLGLAAQAMIEPMRVQVKDPWQRKMQSGKTARVECDVQLAMPAEQLREGTLRFRLVSRETGREALARQIKSPQSQQSLTLNVSALPWGAYDLQAAFHDRAGREVVSVKRLATVLPGGKQQVRVLNNLVSELMDARARGLLQSRGIEFMNPRDGWVWFCTAGNCTLVLGDDRIPAGEAMRLLPAGRHVLQVSGAPSDLVVRAIPALVYNVYPSSTQIAPFGANTWERLRKHTLPNANMIESPLVDVPEQKEWTAQGKKWLTNVQAPGLIDTKDWTEEKLLELWLKPGTSTAHAERPGLELAKISGMQVDEYYPGAKSTRFMMPLARSLARFAELPESAGKFWIPFTAGKYGAAPDNLLMRAVLGAGWPFSEEVYAGEMPTEADNLDRLRAQFLSVAESYESAHLGSLRRMIFTPMYAYLPYCTANRYPQSDFRVHLDMQMQLLASDPAFFGLWGVQPYRSNYVDEEILNCMGRLLRHYCIEGKTTRMLNDPYELRHVSDPDFESGTARWQIAAAEDGAVGAGQFAGYGTLEGRYPGGAMGDAFLRMKRSAKRPNVVSQQLQGLKPGRLYSLKLITADYGDLRAGKSRKATQTVSITLDGAEVLPGSFSYPFHSCREVKQFTAKTPFWMTYHWLRFRAAGPTAKLVITDWAKPDAPGAPIGQELILNFVELQPVLE